eukprot:6308022-Pyramimonas_sp.AAC.2
MGPRSATGGQGAPRRPLFREARRRMQPKGRDLERARGHARHGGCLFMPTNPANDGGALRALAHAPQCDPRA